MAMRMWIILTNVEELIWQDLWIFWEEDEDVLQTEVTFFA